MKQRFFAISRLALWVGCFLLAAGCGDRMVDQALDTDANGYLCRKCSTKFYTDRETFAGHCPQCKSTELDTVLGFICEADKHVTLGARSRGAMRCEKCKAPTTGKSIPRENDLKGWGAVKKAPADVGS